MVRLLSAGDIHPYQRVAERALMGDWSPPPLTLKTCFTMLDSVEMSGSQDNPPSLASLRAIRGKLRAGKGPHTSSPPSDPLLQTPLFCETPEIAPVLDSLPTEIATVRELLPNVSEKSRPKSPLNSSIAMERRIWSVRALVAGI